MRQVRYEKIGDHVIAVAKATRVPSISDMVKEYVPRDETDRLIDRICGTRQSVACPVLPWDESEYKRRAKGRGI